MSDVQFARFVGKAPTVLLFLLLTPPFLPIHAGATDTPKASLPSGPPAFSAFPSDDEIGRARVLSVPLRKTGATQTSRLENAAELAQPAYPRKGRVEIGQEAASGAAIATGGLRTQGQGERLDVCFEDLLEAASGLIHTICEEPKLIRCSTARAYSRQTSWGASWT